MASGFCSDMSFTPPRIVITGIGLTAPNGNTLAEYRQNLLDGVSGVQPFDVRYMGKSLAGICDYDPLKYQKRKEVRVGTRAGSISIYCAREAVVTVALILRPCRRIASVFTSARPSTATSRRRMKSTRFRNLTTIRSIGRTITTRGR